MYRRNYLDCCFITSFDPQNTKLCSYVWVGYVKYLVDCWPPSWPFVIVFSSFLVSAVNFQNSVFGTESFFETNEESWLCPAGWKATLCGGADLDTSRHILMRQRQNGTKIIRMTERGAEYYFVSCGMTFI